MKKRPILDLPRSVRERLVALAHRRDEEPKLVRSDLQNEPSGLPGVVDVIQQFVTQPLDAARSGAPFQLTWLPVARRIRGIWTSAERRS